MATGFPEFLAGLTTRGEKEMSIGVSGPTGRLRWLLFAAVDGEEIRDILGRDIIQPKDLQRSSNLRGPEAAVGQGDNLVLARAQ